jgi:hypothetical protein
MKKTISCLILTLFLSVALTSISYAEDKSNDAGLTLNGDEEK